MTDYYTQNGLSAYRNYIAIKQHFTKPSYDYFKYNGGTNASMDSYRKRKDAIFFEMIGKMPEPVLYMAYTIAMNSKVYPKELATSPILKNDFIKFKASLDSLSYFLRQELSKLGVEDNMSLLDLVSTKRQTSHTPLIKQYIAGNVSILTMCALNRKLGFVPVYDNAIVDPIVWPKISTTIKKLDPFLTFDSAAVWQAILKLTAQSTIPSRSKQAT